MNGPPPATDPSETFNLTDCARAPIHIPGTIQPHGVLLATGADLRITHVSANAASLTGLPPVASLGLGLHEILGREACATLLQAVDHEFFGPGYPLAVSLSRTGPHSAYAHRAPNGMIVELEPAAPAAFDAVAAQAQAAVAKLRGIRRAGELYSRLVRDVRALTGYDRTMLYRFDEEGHGEVIAEDRAPELEPYLNLHYPAADIPPQARALYLRQRIRVIPDAGYAPVTVLGGADLDMSLCGLRGISPVHLEYLRNMGVGATLVVSIVQEDQHWGMLVCHHRRPLLPSPGARALCALLGQLMGLLIGEMTAREQLAARLGAQRRLGQIAECLDGAHSIGDGLAAAAADLLGLVNAGGAYLRIGGEARCFGVTPPPAAAEAILTALRTTPEDIAATDKLTQTHPQFAAEAAAASGALLVPLTSHPGCGHPGSGLLWFRPERAHTVTWGGDPLHATPPEGGRLGPRSSFAAWQQTVSGQSQPWSEADRLAAQDLRRILTRALLRQTEAELARQSNMDPLTGLPNRRVLEARLAAWQAQPGRRPACLIFLDIDRFKTVNDSLGHVAGDELLQQVALRLAMLAGADLLLIRLGGDEFVIFAEGVSNAAVPRLTNRVLGLFQAAFPVAGWSHHATASAGVVWSRDASRDMMRQADAAMHAAKRAGGNRAVMFQTALHRQVMEKWRTEQDLFHAIEQTQFFLVYQPMVRLKDRSLFGYEALIRWRHPERGLLLPQSFILIAEETGLIGRIGAWVAGETMRQLEAVGDPVLRFGFNVSARQLLTGGFVNDVRRLLAAHQLTGARIAIEVTESTLMEDQAVRELQRLRDLGCRVAIDDFGTGYSSLAYLRRLPVDTIKIDRGFVQRCEIDPAARRFLGAITELGLTLNLRVIAEGIENEAQCAIVRELGCDIGQGFLFGRPQPPGYWRFNPASPAESRSPPAAPPAASGAKRRAAS